MDSRTPHSVSQRRDLDGYDARMVAEDEASVNRNRAQPPSAGWTPLLKDVVRMVDLQFQLLSVDVRQFAQESRAASIATVLGGVLAIASVPVLMLGISQFLVEQFDWNQATTYLVVSIAALVVSATTVAWSVSRLLRAGEALDRSRQELSENLRWIRKTLHHED